MTRSTSTTSTTIDVRSASSRYTTDIGWLHSEHSFSFGSHHDAGTRATACSLFRTTIELRRVAGLAPMAIETWRS